MAVNLQLPPLDNWQDFESLCCDLWKSIWGDPNTQKNGRVGQPQAGVDVYGLPSFSNKYHGVQCKGKNNNYGTQLTTEEIDVECEKARNFIPQINDYVIATTSPRSVILQEHCRQISDNFPFRIGVWSWDDIKSEVQCRQELMKKYYLGYEEFYSSPHEYVIDLNTTQDKLAAFFTRPNIKQSMSADVLSLIFPLIYELAENAFRHGKAGNCKIDIKGNRIDFIDNGAPFDTRELLKINGRGGTETLRVVLKELEDLELRWEYNDSNVTSLIFYPTALKKELSDKLEITLNDFTGMSREAAGQMAAFHFAKIPPYKKLIVVNVVSEINCGWSYASSYFASLCQRLREGQRIVAYLPSTFIGNNRLKRELDDYPIKIIARGEDCL